MDLREVVLKALENARRSKKSSANRSAPNLCCTPPARRKQFLQSLPIDFARVFIVSSFAFGEGVGKYGEGDLTVDVMAAPGEPCDRCWQVFETLHDGLCPRCHDIVHN
ncbi:MAG: hypothetical protein MZU97_25245 [Bacillus subtilis]|nr:hypothetical protein [Bacillus subtilis]